METENRLQQSVGAGVVVKRGLQLEEMFAALRYPNYRLWFIGQLVSLAGTWMQSTAQQYFVFKLTGDSSSYTGLVAAASGFATWIFTLYGGLVSDRMPRRSLLIITQSTMMILAFILAILTFTGLVQPWHILVLAFLLGIANAFDSPARLAFTLEMVDREVLTNAIAMNGIMFNSSVVVGPALAGLVYYLVGPAWAFTINGLSFIAVIIALLLMKLKPFVPPERKGSAVQDLKEGLKYMFKVPLIRTLVVAIGLVSLFGLSYTTLVPAWADQVLRGDAQTAGWLQAARGVGALIGAGLIAALGRINYKGKLLTLGSLVFPVFMILFALTSNLPLALLLLVFVGGAYVLYANLSNAMVQTASDDQYRGRVMSAYSLAFFGVMPIGALLAGTLADKFGPPAVVLGSGVIMLLLAVATAIFFPYLRRAK